jgi:hypothetical protein
LTDRVICCHLVIQVLSPSDMSLPRW